MLLIHQISNHCYEAVDLDDIVRVRTFPDRETTIMPK